MADDHSEMASPVALNTIQGDTPIDPAEFRPCQECGELVRLAANQCRFCGAVLAGCPPLPELIARVSTILKTTTETAKTTPRRLQPGHAALTTPWRSRTKLSLFLGFGLAGLAVLLNASGYFEQGIFPFGSPFGGNKEWLATALLWLVAIVFLLLRFFYWRWQEVIPPAPEIRATPAASFKMFINAMRWGRWDYAYSFLLPADKNTVPRARVKQEKIYLSGGVFSVETVQQFRAYWQPLFRSTWIITRRARVHDWQVEQLNDQYAIGTCRYILSATPDALFSRGLGIYLMVILGAGLLSWFLALIGLALLVYGIVLAIIPWVILHFALKHKTEITITKHLRCVNSEWFILCGDIQSGADMLPRLYAGEWGRLERGELPLGYTFVSAPLATASATAENIEADSTSPTASVDALETAAPEGDSSAVSRALVERLARTLHDARTRAAQKNFPHEDAKRYGRKIRWLTWGLLALTPMPGLLLPLAAYLFAGRYAALGENLSLLLAITGAATLVILWGVALYDDWRVPSASVRANPLTGFQAWFRAMQTGRWNYALYCILPADREDVSRPRPAFASPRVDGGTFMVRTASELREYWRPLTHAYFIANRSLRKLRLRVEMIDDNNALVHCRYHLPSDGFALTFFFLFPLSWILLPLLARMFNSQEMTFIKHLHRVDELWYVVTADMQSGIDTLAKQYASDLPTLANGELPAQEVAR